MNAQNKLAHMLQELNKSGLHRSRKLAFNNEKGQLNFSCNDYLSLAKEPRIAKAYQQGFNQLPIGSGGSMLLSGYHDAHRKLEQAFARFLGVDDALLLSSGYAANLAVSGLLKKLELHALIDKGIHASVYDGLRMYQMSYSRYLHQDLNDFNRKLKSCSEQSIIMTEGIFSMSGQLADLTQLSAACQQQNHLMIVDEAHSFGLLGEGGRGAVHQHHLDSKNVPLRVIPLGKAFGAQGAIIAGNSEWIDGVIQFGRSYIYSTAISPAVAYGMLYTLEFLAEADARREKLAALIKLFRQQVRHSCLDWTDSLSAIQQLKLTCAYKSLYFSKALEKHGIFCLPLRPPTVSKHETGLRVILNQCHQPEDIIRLFKLLHEIEHDYSLQQAG